MSEEDEKKDSPVTNIYISDSVINRSNIANEKENSNDTNDRENLDELYNTALEIVKSERKASTSFLQRKLQIGYNRAARIVDAFERKGIVSPANSMGRREVLIEE